MNTFSFRAALLAVLLIVYLTAVIAITLMLRALRKDAKHTARRQSIRLVEQSKAGRAR